MWREEVGRENGEKGGSEGGRDVGLSHPVACSGDMSFSSIHREKGRERWERGMEQWRGREDRNTGPLLTTTLSQEPEASATARNFPHRQGHVTQDIKKAQHAQNCVLFLHNH